jgi:pimeloyl-ACP methyl ester carboxylesterase
MSVPRSVAGWLVVFWLAGSCAASAVSNSDELLALSTPKGTLWGSLRTPEVPLRCPVALIIAGSGPTDRDGNSTLLPGKNNSLRLLAEALARNGIATLRYDKRGIGASAAALTNEADVRFEDYVEDAVGWINRLRPDKRFSSITILGHSEGSLIGMRACQQTACDGFVSIAGPGRPAAVLLHEQLAAQLSADLLSQADFILSELSAGRTVASVPASLAVVFRASVQPYLVSWLRYDPGVEIASLSKPVLIVQGTTDIQVSEPDAEALARAKPDALRRTIDGMNHVLKMVPLDNVKQADSYSNPALPVAPELVDAVVQFIYGSVAPAKSERIVHVPASAGSDGIQPRLVLDEGVYFVTPFRGEFTAFEVQLAAGSTYVAWFDVAGASLGRRSIGDRSREDVSADVAAASYAGQFIRLTSREQVEFLPPLISESKLSGGVSLIIQPVASSLDNRLAVRSLKPSGEIQIDWSVPGDAVDCLLVSPDLQSWSQEHDWITTSPGARAYRMRAGPQKAAFVLRLSAE